MFFIIEKIPGNLMLVYGGHEVAKVAQDTSHQDTVECQSRNHKNPSWLKILFFNHKWKPKMDVLFTIIMANESEITISPSTSAGTVPIGLIFMKSWGYKQYTYRLIR